MSRPRPAAVQRSLVARAARTRADGRAAPEVSSAGPCVLRSAPARGTSAPASPRTVPVWLRIVPALLIGALALFARAEARADALRPEDAPLGTRPGDPPALPSEYQYREVDQDGIRFAYHPSARERLRPLFEKAGAIRAVLAEATGVDVLRRVEVRVTAVPAEMVQLAPGDVPASAASVAFFEQRLVVMSVLSPSSSAPLDVEAALRHALAHIALDEAMGGAALPAWFHEGFAIHAEGADLGRWRALVASALFGAPPSLDDLARSGARGDADAAHAGDFVRFLGAAHDGAGHAALPALLHLAKEGEPFDSALVLALDAPDRATVEARWRADRARRHAFVPVLVALLGVVGLLAAAWRWVARSRKARVERARLPARPAAVHKPSRPPAKVAAAARLAAGRGRDAAIHVPRDPDVPKVQHNGEWHTLH